MAFPLLPLIGMGVQAIGAFLSANQASEAEKARAEAASKPQTTTTSIDFVAMRKAAEEAGFNPLSALRSGAAAGFMQTSSQVSYPVLSSISPFGEGLQAIGGALSAFQWDPLADQRAAVEYDIAKETLTNLRGQNMSFQVPSYQGSSRVRTSGGFAVAEPEPLIAARVGGIQVQPASGWSNAQEIEDRYGDVAGSLYGVGVVAADAAETYAKSSLPEWVADQFVSFARYLDSRRSAATVGGGF